MPACAVLTPKTPVPHNPSTPTTQSQLTSSANTRAASRRAARASTGMFSCGRQVRGVPSSSRLKCLLNTSRILLTRVRAASCWRVLAKQHSSRRYGRHQVPCMQRLDINHRRHNMPDSKPSCGTACDLGDANPPLLPHPYNSTHLQQVAQLLVSCALQPPRKHLLLISLQHNTRQR